MSAAPVGRYRPPYPTREELLGLRPAHTIDPPQTAPPVVSTVKSSYSNNPFIVTHDAPPAPPRKDGVPPPPEKDDVPPLRPRKDSLSPARWNGTVQTEAGPFAAPAEAPKDNSVESSPVSPGEDLRQRRSERKATPVGPPNLDLNSATAAVPVSTTIAHISPKKEEFERPLPALPPQPQAFLQRPTYSQASSFPQPPTQQPTRKPTQQPTQETTQQTTQQPPQEAIQQLKQQPREQSPSRNVSPPRNVNLPGRQIRKPLGESQSMPLLSDTMGNSTSRPSQPEISAPIPRRPVQNNTQIRPVPSRGQENITPPSEAEREQVPHLRVEGSLPKSVDFLPKRRDVPTSKPLPPRQDTPPPTPKASPEPQSVVAVAKTRTVPSHEAQSFQPAEPTKLPPPAMHPITGGRYSTAIADLLDSYGGPSSQLVSNEHENHSIVKAIEESENSNSAAVSSSSNYTSNSANVSPVQDSADSITPPSSYPDEDDRPLTPLNAPSGNKSIKWNLNTVQYNCYADHRNMKKSRNERHPMPCMMCNVVDQEPRWKCTWCCIRICHGCNWLLHEKCGRTIEGLLDMLGQDGQNGYELKAKFAPEPAVV